MYTSAARVTVSAARDKCRRGMEAGLRPTARRRKLKAKVLAAHLSRDTLQTPRTLDVAVRPEESIQLVLGGIVRQIVDLDRNCSGRGKVSGAQVFAPRGLLSSRQSTRLCEASLPSSCKTSLPTTPGPVLRTELIHIAGVSAHFGVLFSGRRLKTRDSCFSNAFPFTQS